MLVSLHSSVERYWFTLIICLSLSVYTDATLPENFPLTSSCAILLSEAELASGILICISGVYFIFSTALWLMTPDDFLRILSDSAAYQVLKDQEEG